MCQPLPHGRCAADSRPQYQKAREVLESIREDPNFSDLSNPENLKKFRTAQFNVMYRRLVYTATPEGLKKSRLKIEEHNGSEAQIQDEIRYYEDALELVHANSKNVSRFFAESTYVNPADPKKTILAMPLSITNIAQVNDWIIASHQEAPPVPTPVDEETSFPVAPKASENDEPVVKANVKIFNKKGKLHFQQDGKEYSLSEKAYLIRAVGEKEFTLVPASKFETIYKSTIDDNHEPHIVFGKVWPSSRLSDYIELAQKGKNKD